MSFSIMTGETTDISKCEQMPELKYTYIKTKYY